MEFPPCPNPFPVKPRLAQTAVEQEHLLQVFHPHLSLIHIPTVSRFGAGTHWLTDKSTFDWQAKND
uniref:Uncharacterized protein n=1 Tax=Anguilla anguilla TaxID=7936 RepID=A0A0E9RGR1_ANGAN